jgi:hypothetical protein
MTHPSLQGARPEVRVLITCARPWLDAGDLRGLRTLVEGELDWELLLSLAERHAVVPLLYRHLCASGAVRLPAAFDQRLRRLYFGSVSLAMFLTEELRRVLRVLADGGIEALAYKGPALAVHLYGDVSLRTFRDLDLLVRPRDFVAARAALAEAGFRPRAPLTPAQARAARATECDEGLVHGERGTLVELHWAVAPPYFSFPLSADELIARAVPIDILGFAAVAPSREDLVLLLAMNGTKDLWRRIEPACLLAEVLRAETAPDWSLVLARAQAVHGERMLGLALRLAADLLGAPFPEPLRTHFESDRGLEAIVDQARRRLLGATAGSPITGLLEGTLFRLRARERWTDRALHSLLRAVMPTHADVAGLPLPAALWPVAGLVRPVRLLARAVKPAPTTTRR